MRRNGGLSCAGSCKQAGKTHDRATDSTEDTDHGKPPTRQRTRIREGPRTTRKTRMAGIRRGRPPAGRGGHVRQQTQAVRSWEVACVSCLACILSRAQRGSTNALRPLRFLRCSVSEIRSLRPLRSLVRLVPSLPRTGAIVARCSDVIRRRPSRSPMRSMPRCRVSWSKQKRTDHLSPTARVSVDVEIVADHDFAVVRRPISSRYCSSETPGRAARPRGDRG